jgi:hypothetical protein
MPGVAQRRITDRNNDAVPTVRTAAGEMQKGLTEEKAQDIELGNLDPGPVGVHHDCFSLSDVTARCRASHAQGMRSGRGAARLPGQAIYEVHTGAAIAVILKAWRKGFWRKERCILASATWDSVRSDMHVQGRRSQGPASLHQLDEEAQT